jgi:hypothetical protein
MPQKARRKNVEMINKNSYLIDKIKLKIKKVLVVNNNVSNCGEIHIILTGTDKTT